MADGPRKIVHEVEGGHVPLPLPRQDRPAGTLVGRRAQRGVVQAQNRLDVVRGIERLLQRPGRNPGKGLPLGRNLAVIFDIGMVIRVSRGPLVSVCLERALGPYERRAGRQGHQLG